MTEPTVGDLARAAQDAAPGSIRVGRFLVTYRGTYDFGDVPATSEVEEKEEQP